MCCAAQDNAGWPSGMRSIRLLNTETLELVKVADMRFNRWYPSATLMPNNKVVIMGGTQVRAHEGHAGHLCAASIPVV